MNNNGLGQKYEDGQVIVKQGAVGDCLYVVQRGRVEVIKEEEDHEVKLTELGPSEFFGEMGLFEQDVRSCTVKAVGDTTVMTIDKKNFYHTIQNDPSLAFRLLEMMSNRLRQTNQKLSEIQALLTH